MVPIELPEEDMKATKPIQLNNRTAKHRNADVPIVRHPMPRLARWIERNIFKIDVYELRDDEVVPARPREPHFKVQDVSSWQQVFICLGVPVIIIRLNDGRRLELSDKHEDLRHILQGVAAERELPWNAI